MGLRRRQLPEMESTPDSGTRIGADANRLPTIFRVSEARRSAVERHLLALGADDRYLRFGHTAGDETIRRYAAAIDFDADIVLAIGDAAHGFLIGVAHVALHAGRAEFGLSVLPQWRCRGLGRWLFIEAMRAATGAGMRSVDCITGNTSVLNMAREEGFAVCLSAGEPRATLWVR